MQSANTIAVTVPVINYQPLSAMEYVAYVARISSEREDKTAEPLKLVDYLRRNGHWSPFEHFYVSIEIKTNRAISAQLMRHRSATFQEFSQRYTEVQLPEKLPEMRMQAKVNRQGSTDKILNDFDVVTQARAHAVESISLYNNMIDAGVAKECARMYLPMFAETTVIMTNNLRGWYHFLNGRLSEFAQKEMQELSAMIQKELITVAGAALFTDIKE